MFASASRKFRIWLSRGRGWTDWSGNEKKERKSEEIILKWCMFVKTSEFFILSNYLPGKSVYCLRLCQYCCKHLDVLAQWNTFGFFLSNSSKSLSVGAGCVLLLIVDKSSVSALLSNVLRWTCNTTSGWRFRMACSANLDMVALYNKAFHLEFTSVNVKWQLNLIPRCTKDKSLV